MSDPAKQPSDTEESSTAPSSITFGKYELFASLGRGGMADVYLSVARGPMGFKKLAVVKRIRRSVADEPTFLRMFLDEARVAARLNHPNVVHTYEVGEHNAAYFIAMEYLEGQSLNRVIREALKRKAPLEESFCVRVVADALNGLAHAHNLKDYDGTPLRIIHRDVSPHNIFVTYDGHTKLCDFGIAKAALSSTDTEVGVLKGKVAYMSPEQATGAPIDQRTDVFSMGIVLWELLSGVRLMNGDSAASTLKKLANDAIPRVSERRRVDPELDAIVAKALEKDRDARFATAGEMHDALEKVLLRNPCRQSDVGRHMSALFHRVKEEAEHQVQKHMAILKEAEARRDILPLTSETLRKLDRSAANGSGPLVRLNDTFGHSGSFMGTFPRGPVAAVPLEDPRRSSVVPWAIALVLLGIVAVCAVVVAVRAGPPPAAPIATTVRTPRLPALAPSPSVVGSTPIQADASTAPLHASVPRQAAQGSSEPKKEGFLTFDTYPWTNVSEGGRPLGVTPLNRVPLSAGSHTLLVENPEHGISETHVVTITAGKVTRGRLSLR
jgi:serine/threonine protein kinase